MSRHSLLRYVIRDLASSDIEPLLDMTEVVAREGRWIGVEFPFDRDQRKKRVIDGIEDGSSLMFVVDADGTMVGEAGLHRMVPGLYGIEMMLLAEWRGRGVGSELMRTLIDKAKTVDAYKLTLQVWPHNEPALKLYEKFGFEREGYLKSHWRRKNGELWDAIEMGLILDDSRGMKQQD